MQFLVLCLSSFIFHHFLFLKMTPEQYDNLCRHIKNNQIFFDGPIPQNEWPPSHRELFSNIQTLGQKSHCQYKTDTASRAVDEPWSAHIVRRAERLAEIAKRLRSENRNEAGWRLELEPEILSRFSIEVAW